MFLGHAHAQCFTGHGDTQLSDQSVVSLITVTPGNQIHTFWGHTALRIQDPVNGIDFMYNYGAFQFDAYFVPKFVYGELDYMLCVSHMRQEKRKYELQKRSLIEQKLRLTQIERQEIFNFVENNALPENRTYRYDFLFDNCSTRLRDLLEDVLGNRLTYHTEAPDSTYRQILQPAVHAYPFLSLGIDVALGLPVEQKPSARELMGLPLYMMKSYDGAKVEVDGDSLPLVFEKSTILSVDVPEGESERGHARILFYSLIWGLFLLSLWVSYAKASYCIQLRSWFDRFLFGLVGLSGILAVFLWFIALHNVTNNNLNLLWAWPTHFGIIWMLSHQKEIVKVYMRICAITLMIFLCGWSFWPQELNVNQVPIILALLVRSAWWGWSSQKK